MKFISANKTKNEENDSPYYIHTYYRMEHKLQDFSRAPSNDEHDVILCSSLEIRRDGI